MRIVLFLLAIAVAWLWWRSRRLEARLLQFQDRAIDWRLHLGRRQEELEEQIRSLASEAGSRRAPSPPVSEAASGSLIQIRPLGESRR